MSLSKRYIYVANHASYLDPLVLWSVLSIRQRFSGAPTKVMTAPMVYYSAIRPIIWLLGAFPAKSKRPDYKYSGVNGSIEYLRQGYNICIFPEGKRSLPSENQAYTGVSQILKKSDDLEMILIRIIWHKGPWWRRKLELRAAPANSSLDRHDPHEIMKAIYAL